MKMNNPSVTGTPGMPVGVPVAPYPQQAPIAPQPQQYAPQPQQQPQQYAPQAQPQPLQYAPQQQYAPPVQQQQYSPGPIAAPVVAGPPTVFGGAMSTGMGDISSFIAGLDLSNVAESNFIALPLKDQSGNPVTYEARITKVTEKPSSTGNKMIVLTLVVTYPEMVDGIRTAGASLSDNITFGDNSLWKLKSLLRATDTIAADNKTPQLGPKGIQEWVDNIIRFSTRLEEYPEGSNEFRSKISSGYSAGYQTPGLSGVPTEPPQPEPIQPQMIQPQMMQPQMMQPQQPQQQQQPQQPQQQQWSPSTDPNMQPQMQQPQYAPQAQQYGEPQVPPQYAPQQYQMPVNPPTQTGPNFGPK